MKKLLLCFFLAGCSSRPLVSQQNDYCLLSAGNKSFDTDMDFTCLPGNNSFFIYNESINEGIEIDLISNGANGYEGEFTHNRLKGVLCGNCAEDTFNLPCDNNQSYYGDAEVKSNAHYTEISFSVSCSSPGIAYQSYPIYFIFIPAQQ